MDTMRAKVPSGLSSCGSRPLVQHRHLALTRNRAPLNMPHTATSTARRAPYVAYRAAVPAASFRQQLLTARLSSSSSSSSGRGNSLVFNNGHISRGDVLVCKYRESSDNPSIASTATTAPSSSSSSPTLTDGSTTPTTHRGTAVVVGAGPAGATAAMYLARAGYRVHVIERRGHPGTMVADIKRTYLIGLGERGLGALDGLGIQVPLSVGRPMYGSVYAYKSGKRVEDPFTPATRIVGVDRQGLAAFLVDQAQQRYPGAISFHWNAQPTDFDFVNKTLKCSKTETSSSSGGGGNGDSAKHDNDLPQVLSYDLLIGADGAASNVRAALLDAVPGMHITQLTSPVAEMEYKAFHNLPWNDEIRTLLPKYGSRSSGTAAAAAAAAGGGEEQGGGGGVNAAADQAVRKEAAEASAAVAAIAAAPAQAAAAAPAAAAEDHGLGEGMTFFAFNNPQPNQPSPGSITLYLNASGRWSGTVYQPPGKYEAMHGDVAAHESAIKQFTPDTFPHDWVPEMAKQMAEVKPSRINPMRLVSDLAAPSLGVVLLGDAAHNVTPQMGQGCNSALEDAALLDQALSSSNYNIKDGLKHFQHKRKPQVHALQRMEEENSWVRRPARIFQDPIDKTLARFAWISFFVLLPLLRVLPGMKQYVHASLFQTIMSTTIPYNKLHRAIRVAPFIMLGLLGGFVYAVVWAVKEGVCLAMKAMSRL